ncbi:glycosyltransferase [Terriglobus saanensis]|uniref:UDP-glucuronosyl/UDP-glucosyltransferase n=1 Tax=Terriglobus saanensis (strain ATCC BAA-1853 / DSM 23119 / SP1PR4) TaxID=401053 RepID=E8V301_TERSS|nr:nucleotide disphospho-sugar-binding domain-containing protein [Terriglobus saanensis]ADV84698.1 UDP-glucuronosyl/UDP-glucosyltransferase [Terriglobus saanensis SP1PR4]
MSKILVATFPLAGHAGPMLVVAEFLRQQGHDVFFHSSDFYREKAKARDLRFLPLMGNANYDYHKLGELIPSLRTATSPLDQSLLSVKHLLGDRIPDQYRGLLKILDEEKIDLILTDVGFWGVFPLLLRKGPRPPVFACGTTAPMWLDPAFSILTGPDETPDGLRRNLEDNRKWEVERAPADRYVDEVLQKLGAQVPGGFRLGDTMYSLPDLFLQMGTEEFEFPQHNRRPNLRFVGPILPQSKELVKVPWLDDSRPVIFVTQGTLANFNFDQLVNPALAGLSGEDVQVVVTAGGGPRDTIVATKNAIVEPYLPYELILPKTSVFVTNGGYNGIQQALSYGIPVVTAGATEDKPQVCARVRWSGVGIDLQTGAPTGEQIRHAVLQVLRDSSYRERAKVLGSSISKTNALKAIAEIAERSISENAGQKAGRFSMPVV